LAALFVPRFQRLLGHNRVVETAIAAPHKTAQRASLANPPPGRHVASVAGQAGQHGVVVGQAGGGNLMPSGAPREDRRAEDFAVLNTRDVAVAQPNHVKRHVGKIPEIDLRRY
jgi:hypothetical protein